MTNDHTVIGIYRFLNSIHGLECSFDLVISAGSPDLSYKCNRDSARLLVLSVVASGHPWSLLPPYCFRARKLLRIRVITVIRVNCRMCQQLVPHVC